MFVRLAITAFTIIFVTSSKAETINSLDQKTDVVRLCTRIIDEYGAYLAGVKRPRNIIALQREYTRCAEVIGEYDDMRR